MPSTEFTGLLDQIPLLVAWVAYAGLHSWLATTHVKAAMGTRWPKPAPSYRTLYNLLAVLLLLPIAVLMWRTPGPEVWRWHGAAAWLVNGLALSCLLAFVATRPAYDMRAFFGLGQTQPTAPHRLVIGAWHRHVRHPWYFVALVLVWTRDMNAASLVSALAITLYFVLGSRLEEEKLIVEFGDRYREYRQSVPALLPLPCKRLSKIEAARLSGVGDTD